MKKISILGSTGSIGVNALSVIKNFPENFRVIHLTGNLNSEKMIEQGKEFLPNSITMIDEQAAEKVKSGLKEFDIKVGQNGSKLGQNVSK